MKKFFKDWWLVLVAVILTITFAVAGCYDYVNEAGQTVTTLTPGAANTLDTAAELVPVVQDVLIGASIVFPALAGLFGIIGGAIGAGKLAYNKYRPQIVAEQDKAETYGNFTKALVYAIEEFKTTNSGDWDTLKYSLQLELKDKVGPEYLAVIDALKDSFYKDEDQAK